MKCECGHEEKFHLPKGRCGYWDILSGNDCDCEKFAKVNNKEKEVKK